MPIRDDEATATNPATCPPGRDWLIDAARVVSILAVVSMHWISTHTWVDETGAVKTKLALQGPLAFASGWLFQVMPLLFLVGGYAGAIVIDRLRTAGTWTYPGFIAARVRRLITPVVWFVAVLAPILATVGAVSPDAAALGGDTMARPLWFLAAYLVTIALAPAFLRAHDAAPIATVAGLAAIAIAADYTRLIGGVQAAQWVSWLAVWTLCQQWGFWYRRRVLHTVSPALLAATIFATIAVLWAAVTFGPYPAAMVATAETNITNLIPPTVIIPIYGLLQFLLLIAGVRLVTGARKAASSAEPGPRVQQLIRTTNAAAMGVYLWHIPVLTLLTGVALTAPAVLLPEGTVAYWSHRPGWIALSLVLLIPFLAAAAWFDRATTRPATTHPVRIAAAWALGVTGVFCLWHYGLTWTVGGIGGAVCVFISAAIVTQWSSGPAPATATTPPATAAPPE